MSAKKQKKLFVCPTCGTQFYRLESQCNSATPYCSRRCVHKDKEPYNKGVFEIHSKPCAYCGKPITGTGSLVERRKYCGAACSNSAQKIDFVKENGEYTKLYLVWRGMKNRCENPKTKDYPRYGGRGICVCQQWESDYSSFRNWAFENGYRDGLQIDRMNNDGNYDPCNCKWSTRKEQCNNRRDTVYITLWNMTKTINGWADYYGVNRNVIRKLYYSGKPIFLAATKGGG